MWNYRNSGYGGLEIYGQIYGYVEVSGVACTGFATFASFSPKLRKQITGNVSENVLFGDQSETFNKLSLYEQQSVEGEAGIFFVKC